MPKKAPITTCGPCPWGRPIVSSADRIRAAPSPSCSKTSAPEVSLTRQFRADLDLYQAAIDQNAAAIAVFSASGQLVMSNTAYADLWGHDPRELLGVLSLTEATQRWQSATIPAPLWGEIREFAGQRQDRVIWTDTLTMRDQRELFVQVSPLKGGATMLSFEILAERAGAAAHGDDEVAAPATTTERM